MPYLIVREVDKQKRILFQTRQSLYLLVPLQSYLNNSCLVDGLPLNEVRTVTEKSSCPSDLRDEKNRCVGEVVSVFGPPWLAMILKAARR